MSQTNTYNATYGVTTERELRDALLRQDKIILVQSPDTSTAEIECSAFVGNYNWLRLTFLDSEHNYYFDSSKGWFYTPNKKSTAELLSDIDRSLDGKVDKPSVVTISDSGDVVAELNSNTIYIFNGDIDSLTVTLVPDSDNAPEQYHFAFCTGDTAPEVQINGDAIMPSDFIINTNQRYEIDILDSWVAVQSWRLT